MRRLALALPVIVLLAACGESGSSRSVNRERDYYGLRYVPESVDVAYSASEQLRWTGDLQVYELPGKPPALDDPDRPRRPCARPGPQFKADPLVAHGKPDVGSYLGNDLQESGGFDRRPLAVGALGPMKDYRIGAMSNRVPNGIGEDNRIIPIGGNDTRPRSRTGAGTDEIPVQPAGRIGTPVQWEWCLPGDSLKGLPTSTNLPYQK